MFTEQMTQRERIIEFLIANQSFMKEELSELKRMKEAMLKSYSSVFRLDLEEQYDARIRQWIGFQTADALAIPVEYVLIELEKIDLAEFLEV